MCLNYPVKALPGGARRPPLSHPDIVQIRKQPSDANINGTQLTKLLRELNMKCAECSRCTVNSQCYSHCYHSVLYSETQHRFSPIRTPTLTNGVVPRPLCLDSHPRHLSCPQVCCSGSELGDSSPLFTGRTVLPDSSFDSNGS